MLRSPRRQHEYGFRQIELASDGSHARGIESVRIEYHGERIAGERLIGEDVEREIAALHRISLSD